MSKILSKNAATVFGALPTFYRRLVFRWKMRRLLTSKNSWLDIRVAFHPKQVSSDLINKPLENNDATPDTASPETMDEFLSRLS